MMSLGDRPASHLPRVTGVWSECRRGRLQFGCIGVCRAAATGSREVRRTALTTKGLLVSGEKDQAKGRVKQAVGDLTDDKDLKREGKVDEAAGKVKEGVDRVESLGSPGFSRCRSTCP